MSIDALSGIDGRHCQPGRERLPSVPIGPPIESGIEFRTQTPEQILQGPLSDDLTILQFVRPKYIIFNQKG